MKAFLAAFALAVAMPAAADAQRDVTRRSYTFLEDRLVVAVHAEAPGELHVVRGQRGRVEVAARSRDGFAGFGLGGDYTRQLRLTAIGSEAVQYLVVVPEHVSVSVQLPRGGSTLVSDRDGVSTYRWGDSRTAAGYRGGSDFPAQDRGRSDDRLSVEDADWQAAFDRAPIAATTASGLYVVHSGRGRIPALVDVPDLTSIRSLSIRVEGDDFRIAATRPLSLTPGSDGHIVIRVDGQPLDVVLFVPRGGSGLQVQSGGRRLADVMGGRPRSYCGSTVIQQPTPHQNWLTLFPSRGVADCR